MVSDATDMSIAPQTVRIKRKKAEEPVDALYIEQQHFREKRRVTEFLFRRLSDGSDKPRPASSSPRAVSNAVPSIRTTQPGEEELDKFITAPAPPPAAIKQRRYHLTKSVSTPQFPQSPAGGVSKRKRGPNKPAIATFVEGGLRPLKQQKTKKSEKPQGNAAEAPPVSPPPRKRPVVTAAERAWRAQNAGASRPPRPARPSGTKKTGQTIDTPIADWDYDSPALAAQLQELVEKEILQASKSTSKPPAPRESMDETSDGDPDDDEDEYVYDTFVRHPQPASSAILPSPSVGVLVIGEDQQALWATYVAEYAAEEDAAASDGAYSEEEDENAEDFLGNDYPDEEDEGPSDGSDNGSGSLHREDGEEGYGYGSFGGSGADDDDDGEGGDGEGATAEEQREQLRLAYREGMWLVDPGAAKRK
ncbi:MAG: hypothetical protein M1832_003853 [Thelocarpon impressellum]|nr:MAG: hypothetical protein M1832_003853 [Thelocarpon impressellum]